MVLTKGKVHPRTGQNVLQKCHILVYLENNKESKKVVKPTPAKKKKVILDAVVPRRNNRCHY